ncbi:hypothetical protein EKO27_g11180 [Xylaria grammica]|uniref:Protein kinase domain-containing protein n=1 Tax=Xylaria grammica TaxID=363999 RepID=A0A439CP61_9PEZI|nr:hypothetical protein EKO27_g11180 [Xylaria grammica]GAW14613.1 hypothetical protein ANO14919_040160 [Xylariales sp. No.14919]
MDPFAIISAIEMCYGLGTKVIEICETWKNADVEVERRVVIVESAWDRTRRQAEFMVRVVPIMDDHLSRINDDLLRQLSTCLTLAINTLEAVTRRDSLSRPSLFGFGSRAKKASWVWKKDAIDEIVSDLEAWQRRFDPSWFLLMKIADPVIDSELARARVSETRARGLPTAAKQPFAVAAGLRHVLSPKPEQAKDVFLPDTSMEWRDIPFSSVKAGRLVGKDARWYIVDTIEVGAAARVRDIARDVGVLAVKLSRADPLAFGLLNCKGVVAVPRQGHYPQPSHRSSHPNQHDYSCFRFVFRIPEGMEVLQSLRHLLLNSDEHISLSRKVRIARELAKAVNYVHTFAFVHKNVRPESVLCFEEDYGAANQRPAGRSHAFLVGFDAFRAAAAETIMAGDMRWDRNVYRHPLRQGDDPAEKYQMQHDIYSLGVCLLEIGLWESFVEYTTEDEVPGPPQAKLGKTYDDFQAWLQENPLTTPSSRRDDDPLGFLDTVAFRLKDYLVEKARTRLAPRMGEKFARAVLSCLTCLDEGNEDFGGVGAAHAGDDGAAALCFIEGVMKSLDEISV